MVSRTSKQLLVNTVKHTEFHNRKQEEQSMWEMRQREVDIKDKPSTHRNNSRGEHVKLYRTQVMPSKSSHKWAKELTKFEDSLGDDRWGHGGYKELYPDEFISSDSDRDSEKETKRKEKHKHSKKRKRKKSTDEDIPHCSKLSKEIHNSDDSNHDMKEPKKKKHKHKSKHSKHKKHTRKTKT